jgi:enoyl-CoA hydratase
VPPEEHPVVDDEPATRFEVLDSIAYLTLNRPAALNAINGDMIDGLGRGMDRAFAEQDVRALVIRGAGGRAFSTGVDLTYFQSSGTLDDAGKNLVFTATMRDLFLRLEASDVPTVAAIEGFALAGGLELALACDFIVCTDDAAIADQHANFNLMPGAGASQRLPRRVGRQRGLELLLTGRRIDGREAVRIGLALDSCPRGLLDQLIERLVVQLRTKSPVMLRHIKRVVRQGLELPLRDALDIERLTIQEYFSCFDDARTGLEAFNSRDRGSPG